VCASLGYRLWTGRNLGSKENSLQSRISQSTSISLFASLILHLAGKLASCPPPSSCLCKTLVLVSTWRTTHQYRLTGRASPGLSTAPQHLPLPWHYSRSSTLCPERVSGGRRPICGGRAGRGLRRIGIVGIMVSGNHEPLALVHETTWAVV
jgi:hypothetical protein